jgi:hypothetical protein
VGSSLPTTDPANQRAHSPLRSSYKSSTASTAASIAPPQQHPPLPRTRAWRVGTMLSATAVTMRFSCPIFPKRRKRRNARSTLSCLIQPLVPPPRLSSCPQMAMAGQWHWQSHSRSQQERCLADRWRRWRNPRRESGCLHSGFVHPSGHPLTASRQSRDLLDNPVHPCDSDLDH